MAKKRDYKKEYNEYHSNPQQKKNRALRNKARKDNGLKKGDGLEVDHIKPLSKGGSNGKKNQRVVKRKTNRKKGAK
jgi:5-methylcytosine-specific restriction endonuclease McrA